MKSLLAAALLVFAAHSQAETVNGQITETDMFKDHGVSFIPTACTVRTEHASFDDSLNIFVELKSEGNEVNGLYTFWHQAKTELSDLAQKQPIEMNSEAFNGYLKIKQSVLTLSEGEVSGKIDLTLNGDENHEPVVDTTVVTVEGDQLKFKVYRNIQTLSLFRGILVGKATCRLEKPLF